MLKNRLRSIPRHVPVIFNPITVNYLKSSYISLKRQLGVEHSRVHCSERHKYIARSILCDRCGIGLPDIIRRRENRCISDSFRAWLAITLTRMKFLCISLWVIRADYIAIRKDPDDKLLRDLYAVEAVILSDEGALDGVLPPHNAHYMCIGAASLDSRTCT